MDWDIWYKFGNKEEWLKRVKPLNYSEWKTIIDENFPKISNIIEALVSVTVLLWFEDVDLPFALVLIGPPAGYKTTALSVTNEKIKVRSLTNERIEALFYYTDKFTPAAFVSHRVDRNKKKLEEIDLLPKIKDKVLIVPELAPIFGQSDSELLQSMSILTRVLDGKGYTSDSGSQGRRGYRGKHKFMWLAASTPLPYRVWNVMGNLGTKIYFLQMPNIEREEDELAEMLIESDYEKRINSCVDATDRFLCQLVPKETEIKWNKENDPHKVRLMIAKLAKLIARLRGAVNVHTREELTEDGTKEIINYTTPVIEVPDRAAIMLYNLARGHAYVQGRRQISEDDLQLLIEVVLSSAPQDRVAAFRALLESGGELTTTEMMNKIGCSRPTALRTMNTLAILKMALKEETTVNYATSYMIRIHPDLEWCLIKRFVKSWGVKIDKKDKTKPMSKRTNAFFDPIKRNGKREREAQS